MTAEVVRDLLNLKAPILFKGKQSQLTGLAAPDQVVGLEIETEGCRQGLAWYQKNLSAIWDTKTDGSLRGRNNGNPVVGDAFEFVSEPAEIKILIPELVDFYKVTGFTDEANYSDRCSVHVHTNIQDMTPYQVATLCLIYSVVEDVLFRFVNFYGVAANKYRDTNVYCVPWSQCRMNHKVVNTMFTDFNYAFRNWQKYTALNLIPARTLGTLEWRHMHGTADVDKLTVWLNLIGSLMQYSKTHLFDDTVETIKKLNDNSAYRQFFTDTLGAYIPYEGEYETALAHGVVNAKYALMGMKDYVFKKPAKAEKKMMWDDELQVAIQNVDNLAGNAAAEAPILRRNPFRDIPQAEPAPVAPAVPAAGGVAGAVPREIPRNRAQAIRERNAEAQRVQRARDLAARQRALADALPYPLERGLARRDDGNELWAVRDAAGNLWGTDGRSLANLRYTMPLNAHPTYVRGFGNEYWIAVDANWRPIGGIARRAARQENQGEV